MASSVDAKSPAKGVYAAENPNGDDEPRAAQMRRNLARRAQDAGANRAANANRNSETHAYDAK